MFTLYTVNQPTDLDGTDLPMAEGDLASVAAALNDGTYLATAQVADDDGDPVNESQDGTLTVADGTATFRPFSRTPATVFGVTGGGDTLCGYSCPDLTGQEDVDAMVPATLGNLSDLAEVECDGCGTTILRYADAAATEDVRLAVLAATGADGGVAGTGGGCTAFIADLPDGREVWVTCGDASQPDGIGMVAAIRDRQCDEWDDTHILIDGTEANNIAAAHNPVGLYRALRAALVPTH